jgi:geranylgeranyl reductase family protein
VAHYDVAISGAGPAGSTAAVVLARAGARVVLLDRAAFPRDKPCAEYLSPEVNVLVRDLGLAGTIAALCPARLRGFFVYAQDGRGFRATFAGSSAGVPERERGLAIPRTVFDAALLHAATSAGAELRERTRVTGRGGDARGVAVHTLHNGKQEAVQARLLLAADGLRSPIARQLGLMKRCVPHRIALVTHMAGIEELGEYGEMHTSPAGGYCGIAPFGDGRANVAMVVDEREGRRMSRDPAGYLRAALAAYPNLGRRVQGAELCKPVLATSGLSWLARRYHGRRVALVGDASGYYDPFTGEGIYKAMAGGCLAARRLLEALASGDEAGALAAYEHDLRRLYRGKRLVERIVGFVVHRPLLFHHVAARLQRRPDMADTLVGVTGDFLPPGRVLSPAYLARLIL